MAWSGLYLTNAGRQALSLAQNAGTLSFKAVVIGDGAPPVNFNTVTQLTNKLFEVSALYVDVRGSECDIVADLPVRDSPYYLREIGIIVQSGGADVLYAYTNSGSDAQFIANNGTEQTEKRIRLTLAISDVANVTVQTPSVLYAKSSETIQIGGDISETKILTLSQGISGDYPVFNAGEPVKMIFGKIKKALENLVKSSEKCKRDGNTREILLRANAWGSTAPYTQAVTVTGVTAADVPVGSPKIPSGASADVKKSAGYIDGFTTEDGRITFYCNRKKPTVDITVTIKGV